MFSLPFIRGIQIADSTAAFMSIGPFPIGSCLCGFGIRFNWATIPAASSYLIFGAYLTHHGESSAQGLSLAGTVASANAGRILTAGDAGSAFVPHGIMLGVERADVAQIWFPSQVRIDDTAAYLLLVFELDGDAGVAGYAMANVLVEPTVEPRRSFGPSSLPILS